MIFSELCIPFFKIFEMLQNNVLFMSSVCHSCLQIWYQISGYNQILRWQRLGPNFALSSAGAQWSRVCSSLQEVLSSQNYLPAISACQSGPWEHGMSLFCLPRSWLKHVIFSLFRWSRFQVPPLAGCSGGGRHGGLGGLLPSSSACFLSSVHVCGTCLSAVLSTSLSCISGESLFLQLCVDAAGGCPPGLCNSHQLFCLPFQASVAVAIQCASQRQDTQVWCSSLCPPSTCSFFVLLPLPLKCRKHLPIDVWHFVHNSMKYPSLIYNYMIITIVLYKFRPECYQSTGCLLTCNSTSMDSAIHGLK